MTNVPNGPAPAGWFPDSVPGQLRYWDGAQWTEHIAPAAAPAQPQPQPQPQPFQALQVQAQQPQPQQFQAQQTPLPGGFPQAGFTLGAVKEKVKFPTIGWLAMLGAVAGLIGSFLPWITFPSGLGDLNVFGTEGDGVLTIIAAVLVLLIGGIGMAKNSKPVVIIAVVIAALGLATAAYHLSDADDELLASLEASSGIGVYVCIAGFAACILGLLASLKRRPSLG